MADKNFMFVEERLQKLVLNSTPKGSKVVYDQNEKTVYPRLVDLFQEKLKMLVDIRKSSLDGGVLRVATSYSFFEFRSLSVGKSVISYLPFFSVQFVNAKGDDDYVMSMSRGRFHRRMMSITSFEEVQIEVPTIVELDVAQIELGGSRDDSEGLTVWMFK